MLCCSFLTGELRYTLSCTSRLMPPVSRNAAQSLALLAVRAQIWKHDVAVDELVVSDRYCVCAFEINTV